MFEALAVSGEPDLKLLGLSLWALVRAFPESDEDWDRNWINILAIVQAPGSRVEVGGPLLRSNEIAKFTGQLETLYADLRGTAELACIEPALNIKIVCGSNGQMEATINITPDHMTQSHCIVFSLDQSYLPPVISSCKRMLERFPVLGAA